MKEIPRVSRSAGLSAEGQYFHEVEMDCISFTRLCTKGLRVFLLVIQESTIWLSETVRDLEMKVYSLVPTTAAINFNLGRACGLRGAALDLISV